MPNIWLCLELGVSAKTQKRFILASCYFRHAKIAVIVCLRPQHPFLNIYEKSEARNEAIRNSKNRSLQDIEIALTSERLHRNGTRNNLSNMYLDVVIYKLIKKDPVRLHQYHIQFIESSVYTSISNELNVDYISDTVYDMFHLRLQLFTALNLVSFLLMSARIISKRLRANDLVKPLEYCGLRYFAEKFRLILLI